MWFFELSHVTRFRAGKACCGEEGYLSLLGLHYQNTTEWLAPTTSIYFLTALEAAKSTIRVLACSSSGENPLPGLQTAIFSLCGHMAFT